VQLLWVNLLMDTFASLALSTDYPTQSSLLRRPEPRTAPILNTTMWKMIAGQSIYQAAVMFTLHYAGPGLFNATTEEKQRQVQTMGFNIYVWMQFFNQQK
jgi:P-type Ca2+ transporter type 2C